MIESAAFRTCTALTEIRLPAGLSYIGTQAFMETGLTDVVVPGSVRIVDGWAFSQCHSLKSAVLSVGMTTLYDCTFQNSALEYVVLPKSVTTVSDLAFYYCTLKELYYEGTEAEFNAIHIRREGEPLGVPGTTEEIFRTANLHVNFNGLNARGDMDGKNGVATQDARTVLRTAVDLEQIQNGTYDFSRADVNFDAAINTADARLVLRDAVDLEDLSKSGAPLPKGCTASELDTLAAFSGTFTELLQKYQVPQLYGGFGNMAVFRGEKDMLVMLFKNADQPAYLCKRFTPTLSLAQLTAVEKGATPDDILQKDPGAAAGIYSSLGSFYSYVMMSCTTDGRVVLFGFSGGKLSYITVY